MKHVDEYYRLLGLKPGAGSDDVKKAFRSRIKKFHPDIATGAPAQDTARKLIEAYQALKNGPPPGYRSSPGNGRGPSPFEGMGVRTERPSARRPDFRSAHRGPVRDQYNFAREAGRRLYEEIFGWEKPFSHNGVSEDEAEIQHYWDYLKRVLSGEMKDSDPYEEDDEVHEYRYDPTQNYEHSRFDPEDDGGDVGRMYFNRAESVLREVVRKYDVGSALKRKSWIKEYLSSLNNVLILFRDVANRHPAQSPKATRRIQQVKELTGELRQMLHR